MTAFKVMRLPVRAIEISTVKRASSEMDRIGVDPAGIRIMAPKQFHYNLKVEGLTPAQANVLKQEILSAGGEAAIAKGAASCSVPYTGAIVSGTLKQLRILIDKLGVQSFGLPEVALSISEALQNASRHSFTIKGGRRVWSAGKRTLIMGILNVTPDSFYDGGRYMEESRAVERALEMAEEGADWIDVGGESTRPGAEPVPEAEEMKRVIPVVEALSKKGIAVSIDTTKAAVAREALKSGAEIVNDVSAMTMDSAMESVCAEFRCPVVLMHMRGTPETMQLDTGYTDLMGEVFGYLLERLDSAVKAGIDPESLIIDPGIGFGKSREGNVELISNLSELRTLGKPILVGPSRKTFIGKTLGEDGDARLTGTLALLALAIRNGASMLRVHDVREARRVAAMADEIKNAALEEGPLT